MTNSIPPQDNLSEELRRLGQNINHFAKTAWESPERQNIQKELENGFIEISSNLDKSFQEFSETPAAQKIKTELDDFGQRVSNGELETKVKKEVVNLLVLINQHIEQAASHSQSGSDPDSTKPE